MSSSAVQYDKNDLIDDKELSRAEDDQLNHLQFARQLADVALCIPDRSNIALYGPWGSGKTGIANLVKDRVEAKNGDLFARFDAFKYADKPLMRNFITAIARELHIPDKKGKYGENLYADMSTTDVTLSAKQAWKIIRLFAGVLIGLAAILLSGAAVIALFKAGDYDKAFESIAPKALGASVIPSVLLTALIGFFGSAFQVKRNSSKPESDEEFEALFKDLVADSKAKRLVIFVDELDRCSPEEVVSTLDAIRTFLGVERCVFIIAADQNVLERALTAKARQSTPMDSQNPYYSAGSAYLDKVFQYQVSLPPLFPQSITKFAASLVRDRLSGVWHEVDIDRIVSILVPSHVRSPRRVKHLMNAFALAYRAAEVRHQSGQLADDPKASADSIAKLVCLRVEFPIFCKDVEADPDLIAALLSQQKPSDTNRESERRALAKDYAEGELETASIIAIDDSASAGSDDSGLKEVKKKQSEDLINYLVRTSTIPGPSRDLFYMQTKGGIVGLSGTVSNALEKAAQDNQIDDVRDILAELEPDEKSAASRLLVQQAQHELGLVGDNSTKVILSLIADRTLEGVESMDQVADIVASRVGRPGWTLDSDTMEGTWLLGSQGGGSGAKTLREEVMKALAGDSSMDADCMLNSADSARETSTSDLATIVSERLICADAQEFVDRLKECETTQLSILIATARTASIQRLGAQADAWAEAKEAEPSGEAADDSTSALIDPLVVVNALATLATQVANNDSATTHNINAIILGAKSEQARSSVVSSLATIPPTEDAYVAREILNSCSVRAITEWPTWLEAISPKSIRPSHVAPIVSAAKTIWQRLDSKDENREGIEDIAAAVDRLGRLAAQLPTDRKVDIDGMIASSLATEVVDEGGAILRLRLLSGLESLGNAGFVTGPPTIEQLTSDVIQVLGSDIDDAEPKTSLTTYVQRVIHFLQEPPIARWATDPLSWPAIVEAVDECSRIPEPVVTELRLETRTSLRAEDAEIANRGRPDTEHLRVLLESHGTAAHRAVELWLSTASPNAASVRAVLEPSLRSGRIEPRIADAVSIVRSGWTGAERFAFLAPSIEGATLEVPLITTLRALGIQECDEFQVADTLVARYQQCSNNTERRRVLDLWIASGFEDAETHGRLLTGVAIPMMQLDMDGKNERAAVEVLNALSRLGRRFSATNRKQLGSVVEVSARQHGPIRKRAREVLPDLGFGKRSLGWLKGDDIDYGS